MTTITEFDGRLSLVDENGAELAGARQPHGHDTWIIHVTSRLTKHMHQVVTYTKAVALFHLEMLGELYSHQYAEHADVTR